MEATDIISKIDTATCENKQPQNDFLSAKLNFCSENKGTWLHKTLVYTKDIARIQ